MKRMGLFPMLILAACGGGGGPSPPPPELGTLAYVVSECRDAASGYFARFAFVIRSGDHDPVTVVDIPEIGPTQTASRDACRQVFGRQRSGDLMGGVFGAFARLGVRPDGSTVVFEESVAFNEFNNLLTPDQQGIFVVRADGTGLRRLGPPSREPVTTFTTSFNTRSGNFFYHFSFSPDGKTITFPDRGPSLTGDDAAQVFTMDLATGARTQVTHLPFVPEGHAFTAVFHPFFMDNETIVFYSLADPDKPGDLNPEGKVFGFTVKIDGSGLTKLPSPVAQSGAQLVPVFEITGAHPTAVVLTTPGKPTGPPITVPIRHMIQELFILDGENLLQLTSFLRSDTAEFGALAGVDGRTVFFPASADPLGTNPTGNCQLFSIDRLGSDLRQLTDFRESPARCSDQECLSWDGCDYDTVPGCGVALVDQDITNQTVVLQSGCDLLGTNPSGAQIFTMRPDGTGLQQLTSLRGLFTDADGTVHAELPGPIAYGPGLGALP